MGYELLHVTELLSVQCLQVDDVIPILSPAVYCGLKIRLVELLFDGCINYSSCGFQQDDNIGITSSTCRHYILWECIVAVFMESAVFTNILTHECTLGHQSLSVCEVSDT